jgi:hypothetical protein
MSGQLVVDSTTPAAVVTSLIENESRYINGGIYIQEDGTWKPVTFSRDLDWADVRRFARAAGWTWDLGWLPGGVWGVWNIPTSSGNGRVTFRGRREVEIAGPLLGPFYSLIDPTPTRVLEAAYAAVYVAASARKEPVA